MPAPKPITVPDLVCENLKGYHTLSAAPPSFPSPPCALWPTRSDEDGVPIGPLSCRFLPRSFSGQPACAAHLCCDVLDLTACGFAFVCCQAGEGVEADVQGHYGRGRQGTGSSPHDEIDQAPAAEAGGPWLLIVSRPCGSSGDTRPRRLIVPAHPRLCFLVLEMMF